MRVISLAVISTLICPLAGCAGWMTAAGPAQPAASEVAVVAELGLVKSRVASEDTVLAEGPSLVAGDGLAMQWAFAHGVIAARDAGPWAPAVLVLD